MRLNHSIFHVVLATGLSLATPTVTAQQKTAPANYLENAWKQAGGAAAITNAATWQQQLKQRIASRLAAIDAATRQDMIADAEKAMSFSWPSITAEVYLQFRDNGNRINFENIQFERRKVLATLIAGELAENKGRFMPQIVNGLWLILEESTWVLPAHIGAQKQGSNLPDPNEQVIDLFAGETAMTLSWAQFLLRSELDKYSVIVNKRIDYELEKRIYTPYLQRNDFWWMGFKGGQVNNWNIWINSNVLKAALLNLTDTDKRNLVIEKSIRSADNFVNAYAPDGGCDEGPSYWGHAGGKLIELLDDLNSSSGGKLDFSNNKLMHAIGAYIYKMHVDSNRFVNFADASARSVPPSQDVFMYGKMYNDEELKQFGAYLNQLERRGGDNIRISALGIFVYKLLLGDEMLRTKAVAPFAGVNWLPDLQVLSLRSKPGSSAGLFFAAQGGHNAESHNHNDVGNFVLYMNGKPAVIDVGVGTYTKQTFSKDRYKLWYMQSQWHNCPTINGVQQKDGRAFQANHVQFTPQKSADKLQMDIAAAYPAEAQVNKWQRTFNFIPGKQRLELTEAYALKEWKEAFRDHFMTCLPVDASKAGKIVLSAKEGTLVITYNPAEFAVETEQQEIADGRLSPVWGSSVTRITLVSKGKKLTGSHSIAFVME
ncbi:heparinase II/III family protein [Chitinophaga sp. sic0106]|uniref:heparinase II/III domain-containing protein n=1 Tax=Chitinophaga sp. sic0106 TaxID=2854785 RepID=UPI001C46E0DB|nr:heparinase II/III family protein [Chitinophaga sp. sic0106]MBV7534032.1 heparinase II/III-family protein [Chitinophaga sp. sic0106]